ncbi:hypothetical protein V6N11_084349 [Hibiscus sabdariffa]|uniref:Uncharacterized protein n=1 Tax=Hibiscus sabdariffa TaxID=183260 RepID=A0ABR2QSU2_9ROSI
MPACLRVAWLAGGGCASGVFGEPVWQPHGGIGQFRWQHRGGIVQFRWQHRGGTVQFRWQHRGGSCWPCRAAGPIGGVGERWSGLAWMLPGAWLWPPRGHCLPLQHSCATRSPRFDVGLPCALWPPLVAMVSLMSSGLLEYGKVMYRPAYCMHGSVALLATAWLIWCLAWPADWACYFAVVGIMGGVTVGWCASRGTPMPSFATVLIATLSAGSTLSWPVTVADAVVGCLAWRPSFFSWCASKFKGAVLLCIACPGDTPLPRPASLSVVEAVYAEGSMGRPLWPGHAFGSARGLLVVAKGAPLPVLGALGVRDPGVRAGTLARACGFLFRGRSVPPGSVSGHPGGAGRVASRMVALAQGCFLGPASWKANFLFYKLSSLGQL